MEIPENIRNKLICCECNELLSCGPLYVLHETGGTICGRCSEEQEDENDVSGRSRIEPFEALASLFSFPCAFASRGCPERLSFTSGSPLHESICKFRPFICPISTPCEWIGSWPNLKDHCEEAHPENSLQNPCCPPRPALTSSNLHTYLISAFHFLFLLQIKVCVSTGKLFHCVRMFGDPEFLDRFSFTLDIEGNNVKLMKVGSVLRAGIRTIQKSTAICTSINHLMEMLDGKYNETKFVITIKTCEVRRPVCRNCVNCGKNIENMSKFCDECLEKLVKCERSAKSCAFVDVYETNCWKHQKYFCEYLYKCFLDCDKYLDGCSFIEHLKSSSYCRNRIEEANIDSVIRLRPNKKFILFSSDNFGSIICIYDLSKSDLYLNLYTSLPSYELKHLKCSIELTDPETKHSKILTPKTHLDYWKDWFIQERITRFPSRNKIGIDVKININKVE